MTPAVERPSWESISVHLLGDAPVAVPLRGEPKLTVIVDPVRPRVGLRIPDEASVDLPATLRSIELRRIQLDDGPAIELATELEALFPHFYAFVISVADGVQEAALDPISAITRSLHEWEILFSRVGLLSEEKQLGLLGELWLIRRLVDAMGPAGYDAWTGPLGETHDFRLGRREIEVKTTGGERRSHMISSEGQLRPSPDHELYILSLQYAPAGAGGNSLGETVTKLRERCRSVGRCGQLDAVLERSFGIDFENLHQYRERRQLRSTPYLVPITEAFPRVLRTDLLNLPYDDMSRVTDIRYRVDVDGLGWEDGTAAFFDVIPEGT